MTDARVRLIILGILSVVAVCATSALWVRGMAVPNDLQVIDASVFTAFLTHVYMNGSGSGSGGPGAPKQ